MTEFEKQSLSDALTNHVIGLAQLQASHIAIYLTIVFAFIIAVFIAGKKLTRIQARVATILFSLAGFIEVYQIVSTGAGIDYLMNLNAMQYGTPTDFGLPPVLRLIFNTILWSSGLIGALIFMWNIRRPRDQ
jgi:hypothetical protein